MRRRVIAWGISALVLGAAGAAAAADSGAPAAWTSACARCHRDVAALMDGVQAVDDAALRAYLDTFLARHRAPDPAVRAALIDWLVAQRSE